MNTVGLCDTCGKTGVLYTCMLCGRRVCTNCLTPEGVCKDCVRGRAGKTPERR